MFRLMLEDWLIVSELYTGVYTMHVYCTICNDVGNAAMWHRLMQRHK